MAARRPQGAMLAYRCNIHVQRLDSNQSGHLVSILPGDSFDTFPLI